MSEQLSKAQIVAQEIQNQLGGRRFFAMTGSKNLVCHEEKNGDCWLRMNLTKNKIGAKWMKITLVAGDDTYKMEFMKMKRTKNKELSFPGWVHWDEKLVVLESFEGVYNDMLQSIFTDTTGLYTSL